MQKTAKRTRRGRSKNRLPVFREKPELGIIAAKRGFFTLKSLAEHVEAHINSVSDVLRGDDECPNVEKRVSDALGISVRRLRKITRTPDPRTLPLAA